MRLLREVGYKERGHFACTVVFMGTEGTRRRRRRAGSRDCPGGNQWWLKVAPTTASALRKCRARPVFGEKIYTFSHSKK